MFKFKVAMFALNVYVYLFNTEEIRVTRQYPRQLLSEYFCLDIYYDNL